MRTTWHYSLETEATRLLHTACQIATYFYQVRGFRVLPDTPAKNYPHLVIFPDLPYTSIPYFWQKVKAVDVSSPHLQSHPLVENIARLLPQNPQLTHPIEDQWHQLEPQFLKLIHQFFPQTPLKSITINPSRYGTICSFSVISPKQPDLLIQLRLDATLGKLAEAILSALTRQDVNDLDGTWEEGEMIADWLITKTAFANLLPPDIADQHVTTLSSLRRPQTKGFKLESDTYLTKLGFSPDHVPKLTLRDGLITYQDQPITLSSKEHQVLTKLILKKSLTTDQVADIIFAHEDDFSLFALSKFIQRLRKHLNRQGCPGTIIQTVRGFGYRLR